MNKRQELQAYIELYKPHIIGITEVKPKNYRYDILDCELALKDFEMFHNLENDGRGVCLYIHRDLRPSVYDAFDSDFSEHIFVECRAQEEDPLIVGLFYRSPSSSAESNKKLVQLTQKLTE